jgi:hypothetical protein
MMQTSSIETVAWADVDGAADLEIVLDSTGALNAA